MGYGNVMVKWSSAQSSDTLDRRSQMNRPDFFRWRSMYQLCKDVDKKIRKEGPLEFYNRTKIAFQRNTAMAPAERGHTILTCDHELFWYQYGKPYYKTWPGICAQLINTRVDIDGKFLNLPFNSFEICLPKGTELFKDPQGPAVKSLFVCRLENKNFQQDNLRGRDWTLIMNYQFDTEEDCDWMGWFYSMPVTNGVSLEAAFNDVYPRSKPYDDFSPCKELIQRLLRITIGVAFFGIDRHELVLPDLPRKVEERYRSASINKDTSEAEKILREAKKQGMFGWRVGSEISLPTPIIHYNEKPNPEHHRELSYGYIRRGHLRMQTYGPRDKPEHKLIFIAPTPVRPDLPIHDMRGYAIRDPRSGLQSTTARELNPTD